MIKPPQERFFNKELWIYRFLLGFLFFAGFIIIHKPADLWGQTALVIPDDALVYEAKISSLNVTKDTTSITLDGTVALKAHLLFNDQEVLTGSHVQFAVPALNYQAQMVETQTGVYSLTISDQLKIIFTDVYTSLPQVEQWQIEPLSYSFYLGDQTKIEETGGFPVPMGALIKTFGAFVNQPSFVGHINDANLNAGISTIQQYQVDFFVYLRGRLLDENRIPLVNHTFNAAFEIPGQHYSGIISITTDSEGIFTFTRQEPVRIKVTGGNYAVLADPLDIRGISLTAISELASVTGVVTENGVPLEGAAVYIGGNPAAVYTEKTGTYSGAAGAGTVTIIVYTASGEFIGEKTFTVGQGEILKSDFDFVPWPIAGKVTKSGDVLSGARVCAGRNKPVLTDSLGTYSLNVQGEEIKVSVFTPTGEFINEQTVLNRKGATADFDFKPAVVTGLVRENGSPLENAKVYAQFNEPIFTNASGEYSFEVGAGSARVVAYTITDEFIGEQMMTLARGETTAVNFDFNPVTVTGTVFNGGDAVPAIQVYAGANMPVTADAFGRYKTRLQSGTWKIFAEDSSSKQIGETTVQAVPAEILIVNVP